MCILSKFPGEAMVLHIHLSQKHSSEDSKWAGTLDPWIKDLSDCNLQTWQTNNFADNGEKTTLYVALIAIPDKLKDLLESICTVIWV